MSTAASQLPPNRRSHHEAGAALILVMVFMLVGGILVGALATAATGGLANTTNFKGAANSQSDERVAINEAIQAIRYQPLLTTTVTSLNASPPVACWQKTPTPPAGGYTSVYSDASDNVSIAVWCSTAWYPASGSTRVVTFSACGSAIAAATCAFHPGLQAVVTFDDYPPGTTPPSKVACVTYCGTDMTVGSWTLNPTMPTVTSVGNGTGPACTTGGSGAVTGGTAIVICGTGFVSGETSVQFIEESGGVPASDNTVCTSNVNLTTACQIGNVSFQSSTELKATAPVVTEGSTYFVDVTTPSGNSAVTTSTVFTYSTPAPTLSSSNPLSPVKGETAGGTEVTLTGTGFVKGATVKFVEENNGTAVSPTVSITAGYVSVLSDTEIQAVATPIYSGAYTTYFVEVTTTGGTTTTSSADIFTYNVTTPTVSALCSGSCPAGSSGFSQSLAGSPGSTITVQGTSFYSGETVLFQEESGGSTESQSFNGTNVSVLNQSLLTVTVPAPTAGSTFFVYVTTPSPCSTNGQSGNFCTSSNAVTFSVAPTVTNINPTGAAAGTNITITGHYFATDSGNPTVSFLEETGGTLASPLVTVTATVVSASYTTITATVPQVSVGSTYFVTVSTPGGASWTSGTPLPPVFTYSAPTVTALNPNSSNAQNRTISVTGSDFYTTGTTVVFVPVLGGTALAGTNVTVTSATSLSVKAPNLVANTTYNIEVTTPAGTSAVTNADRYTYV